MLKVQGTPLMFSFGSKRNQFHELAAVHSLPPGSKAALVKSSVHVF